ncbi:MAG: leucyl-tRNA synthetase, partial [Glaciecola sp.]
MEYNFSEVEKKWKAKWDETQAYKVNEGQDKKKYYVLDMFPYPSGSGLHIGHPLGYIASDIFSRYKRHQGYNVLHPMGYDSFGLPAEQYAIETGQHPAVTTKNNIARYRSQLDKLGMCYDWSREVRTSDPKYFRWTQWIFKELYNSWYNLDSGKAEPIETLIAKLEDNGNYNINAHLDENWYKELNIEKYNFPFGEFWEGGLTAVDWKSMTEEQQQVILLHYRMAYLAETEVNWCPALGTVLANDEVKAGLSERGGHPVVRKKMMQWSMRITAYADRLLEGLNEIDWSKALKVQQTNWIGKSIGSSVNFQVENSSEKIEVFTTRPDTIFGVSFMVLAPEHPLVDQITTSEYKEEIANYKASVASKSDVERQANAKNISGQFTGAYAIHPFSGEKIALWIGEYVLMGYGTGAVMAVPAGDQRDYDFAKHYHLPIRPIHLSVDISENAYAEKEATLINSDFMDGLKVDDAITLVNKKLEENGIGRAKINFRLRDAIFGRQRYWGEPIPVYMKNDVPYIIDGNDPLELPVVDKYLPTEDGEPPLARAEDWTHEVDGVKYPIEYSTMPGWAGSSWYYLRYMDPHNDNEFCAKEKSDYWGQVDLYIGGSEHATGHLLYSRFWGHFLCDRGLTSFKEPFKKLINQGMIQGRSSLVYRINGT